MSRNTALSLAILGSIMAYFVAIWPRGTAATAVQESQTSSQSQFVPPTPSKAQAPGCGGRITWTMRVGNEIKLTYDGEASTVWAWWQGGEVKSSVEDACKGSECKLFLPRSDIGDVKVGLDNCWEIEMP
jgi:hypothetical protein